MWLIEITKPGVHYSYTVDNHDQALADQSHWQVIKRAEVTISEIRVEWLGHSMVRVIHVPTGMVVSRGPSMHRHVNQNLAIGALCILLQEQDTFTRQIMRQS